MLASKEMRRRTRSKSRWKGAVGPKVTVTIKNYEISEKTQRELLPVMREGNVDYSAIVEGARRVRNKLQEDGFFFAEVTQICTVSNPPADLGAKWHGGNLREPQSDSR